MGEDVPQVPMDPPLFMLPPFSMTNAEYQLWRNDIPYDERLMDEMGYDEFSKSRLMASLISEVCIIFLFTSLPFSCISTHGNTQM